MRTGEHTPKDGTHAHMQNQNTVHCPICGREGCEPYMKCTDRLVSSESFELYQCPDCNMVFTVNPPAESDMRQYDRFKQKIRLYEKQETLTGWLHYRIKIYMLRHKAEFVRKMSYRHTGSLLNYGAEAGFFSDAMEKRGWKVTSVEKYHEQRVFALEMFHHRMIDESDMEQLRPDTFDVITMWHVFEHQYHPDALLDRFHELLKPGGVLIMACPNIESNDARHYGADWAAYNVPRHLLHFSPTTLNNLVSKHGFVLMEHRSMPFDCFYISILSERNHGHRMAFIRGMWYGTKCWLKTLAHRKQASSMVYAFRKK